MKLTERRVRWLVKQKTDGVASTDVGNVLKLSKRRINQVWKEFLETNQIPVYGKNLGRPKAADLTDKGKDMIRGAKKRYKLGARRLERIIERDHGIHIPHNRIHAFLLAAGLANEEPHKKKRRRYIRYERKHSLSAGHMDWHENDRGEKVCAIEDDSSRRILVYGEFDEATEVNSILLFKKLVDEYWHIRPMRELIIDNGSSFGAHRQDELGNWNSAFKEVVEGYGTKIINTGIKHPQTNGKIEKWFDVYERYRADFSSFGEFVEWYNTVRPHESLSERRLITPDQAFWRRLPPEAVLGMCCRVFGW